MGDDDDLFFFLGGVALTFDLFVLFCSVESYFLPPVLDLLAGRVGVRVAVRVERDDGETSLCEGFFLVTGDFLWPAATTRPFPFSLATTGLVGFVGDFDLVNLVEVFDLVGVFELVEVFDLC